MRRLALTALALALAFAFAQPASAEAGPVKNGIYEYNSRYDNASLAVRPDGKRIRYMLVTLDTRCRIGGKRPRYPTTLGLQGKGLIRGGRFSQRRLIRYPSTGATHLDWVKGRFSADGRTLVITARYTLTRRDGRCDTGTKRFVLPLERLSHANPFQGPWSGTTEAGEPVTFDVVGDRIRNLRTRLSVECSTEDESTTSTRDVVIADDAIVEGDLVDVNHDSFSMEGTVSFREPGCFGAAKFTAKPARALTSRR